MSTTTYDPRAASAAARTAAEMRLGQVQGNLDEEYEIAVAFADEYADHLWNGGEPWVYPKTSERRHDLNHGLARVAREAVFDAWNEGRERQSLTYPWGGYGNAGYRWQVHERLLDTLGEPVTYSELAALGTGHSKNSPKDVALAVWTLQVLSRGEVRVRRTKVGTKAAYLARRPAPGDDELTDNAHLDGYTAEEQVAGQYRQHVPYDFPTEEV